MMHTTDIYQVDGKQSEIGEPASKELLRGTPGIAEPERGQRQAISLWCPFGLSAACSSLNVVIIFRDLCSRKDSLAGAQ